MPNEYRYLWAQWGILNYEQYQIALKQFGDLESAWKKIDRLFLMRLGFGQEKVNRLLEIQKTIQFQRLEDFDVRILCVDDPDYPKCLRSISSPPVFLFVRGKLPSFHKSLGVVGTRDITDYGRLTTEKFVSDLTANGFVIVSGLALGVDACAHETTLKNKGVTVAVLGSGIDRVYPAANRYLAEKILEKGGAVLSEYPLGTPAMQHHFPMRNRIISGLSRGVLIVEGGVKSGALITARYALEQGREVFAIPNNITKTGLSGTNHLIRRSEAKLVESVNHILEEFQMQSHVSKQPITFSAIESELLERIANDGKGIDELVLETPYNVAKLSEILITLQLKGVVREIGQKWVIV
ncbi:DNA-processing protein DprA [Candidatus Peregrinibacteria bacterium]|nr:DNA-processing protein DprA [Candidatus Peregrinibacteria bacterium]